MTDTELPRRVMQARSSLTPGDRSASATAAFLAVYQTEFTRLLRVAYLTTGSNAAAEDIVQDAFVDVLRRWNHVRDPPAYLRRAVVNRSTSWLRRRILERRHASTMTLRQLTWHDGDTLAVSEAIQRLSPRQRAAVAMRYLDGLAEADIAAALGCRPGTVKSLLSRSRDLMKEAIEHDR